MVASDSGGGGEKWSDAGDILKENLLTGRCGMRGEKGVWGMEERKVKVDSKISGLSR